MRREENDAMRNLILDAVISCKIEANGEEVSLSQIACRAGISERTLNRYFPDKEMLLYDSAIRHLNQIYKSFAKRYTDIDKNGLNGLQRLTLLIQMQMEHNYEDMTCAKTFVRAYTTAFRTAVYRDLPVVNYDAPIRTIVLNCIQDGIADGSIRKDIEPMNTYLMISSNYLGLVQHLIYFYYVNGSEGKQKEELIHVFNQYLHMLEECVGQRGRTIQ